MSTWVVRIWFLAQATALLSASRRRSLYSTRGMRRTAGWPHQLSRPNPRKYRPPRLNRGRGQYSTFRKTRRAPRDCISVRRWRLGAVSWFWSRSSPSPTTARGGWGRQPRFSSSSLGQGWRDW